LLSKFLQSCMIVLLEYPPDTMNCVLWFSIYYRYTYRP
jgi:hypothetical protein